jgi:endonuclease-3 related protein
MHARKAVVRLPFRWAPRCRALVPTVRQGAAPPPGAWLASLVSARTGFLFALALRTPAILDLARTPGYRENKMPAAHRTSQWNPASRPVKKNSHAATVAPGAFQAPNLRPYYDQLFAAHGPQHWWPGRTPFEVIVGAILVQNTAWTNVASAIENLRREKLLTARAIESVSTPRLARLIRSSGYFRQKGKKLKAFVRFLRQQYQGSLAKMFRAPSSILREQLLSVHGIGPETADSILLYAGHHPVFVVDAYTRRILERHGLAHPKLGYEQVRQLFERSLSPDAALYNEFHALIVRTGKHFCRPREPRCGECPLKSLLPATPMAQIAGSVPQPLVESLSQLSSEPFPGSSPDTLPERTTAAT